MNILKKLTKLVLVVAISISTSVPATAWMMGGKNSLPTSLGIYDSSGRRVPNHDIPEFFRQQKRHAAAVPALRQFFINEKKWVDELVVNKTKEIVMPMLPAIFHESGSACACCQPAEAMETWVTKLQEHAQLLVLEKIKNLSSLKDSVPLAERQALINATCDQMHKMLGFSGSHKHMQAFMDASYSKHEQELKDLQAAGKSYSDVNAMLIERYAVPCLYYSIYQEFLLLQKTYPLKDSDLPAEIRNSVNNDFVKALVADLQDLEKEIKRVLVENDECYLAIMLKPSSKDILECSKNWSQAIEEVKNDLKTMYGKVKPESFKLGEALRLIIKNNESVLIKVGVGSTVSVESMLVGRMLAYKIFSIAACLLLERCDKNQLNCCVDDVICLLNDLNKKFIETATRMISANDVGRVAQSGKVIGKEGRTPNKNKKSKMAKKSQAKKK